MLPMYGEFVVLLLLVLLLLHLYSNHFCPMENRVRAVFFVHVLLSKVHDTWSAGPVRRTILVGRFFPSHTADDRSSRKRPRSSRIMQPDAA